MYSRNMKIQVWIYGRGEILSQKHLNVRRQKRIVSLAAVFVKISYTSFQSNFPNGQSLLYVVSYFSA